MRNDIMYQFEFKFYVLDNYISLEQFDAVI